MKKTIAFIIIFQLLSCKGQNKENCSKENAYDKVIQIQEVKKAINKYKNSSQKLIFNINEGIYNNKEYFIIKEEQEGEFHNSVWNIFYVDKKDCSVFYYDTVNGNLLTIDQWRLLGKKTEKRIMEKISFTDLFNEGTIIKFTLKDLNKNNEEIQNFKKKLELYESQNPILEDFDTDNLSYLVNNETFFDSQYYVDSSWLQYFITKYKIDPIQLGNLMSIAINQEDLMQLRL